MKRNLRSMTTLLMASALLLIPAGTTSAAELDDLAITGYATEASEDAIEPAWFFTKKYVVTGDYVNIRTGAGTSYAVVGTLYKNDIIQVKSIDNGWAKFKYNGQWRYVSATYIKAA